MEELNGRVAMVTGGGRGLGEAICRELSLAGATVVIADMRADLADAVAADLRQQGGQSTAQYSTLPMLRAFGGRLMMSPAGMGVSTCW